MLAQAKEELLKEGKARATTIDNVKSQLELLMKVGHHSSNLDSLSESRLIDGVRNPKESRGSSITFVD